RWLDLHVSSAAKSARPSIDRISWLTHLWWCRWERPALPAPKEQPPRKLSGKRTACRENTLESGATRSHRRCKARPIPGLADTLRSMTEGAACRAYGGPRSLESLKHAKSNSRF